MTYQLGIDFGTTFTSAAVRRDTGPGETEVVSLGGREGVSSVLHLARDERVTIGDAAAGLAGIDPTRVVRGLKRRVGDPTQVLVGGHPWAAEELAARLLRRVVDRVTEHEGEQPARIALAHPVSWTPHTLERLGAALAGQELGVTFVAEPRAVAHAVAAGTSPGDAVGVYDFGGGGFGAAVLRRVDVGGGFAMVGVPEAVADLGGLEVDELVWQHVRTSLPDDVAPVARVRRACTGAKETLSSEHDVVVKIRRGEFRGAVGLDRATFETLIAPHVDRTVDAMRRTIASAGLEPGDLSALLLVGGTSRIPLVARTVTEQLGRVPTAHTDPDLVARGAVLALSVPEVADEPAGPVSTSRLVAAPPRSEPAPAGATPEPVAQETPSERAVDEATSEPAAEEPASTERAVDETTTEPVAEKASSPSVVSADPGAEAPTIVFALPLVDVPTTRIRVPAAPTPAAPPAPAPAPAAEPAVPAPAGGRPSAPARNPAVLDPDTRHGDRRRSLPRVLVGVGAVLVAALVLVALFRPDGPLDPPLDPTADGSYRTAVPVATVPPAVVPAPGPAGRTEIDADGPPKAAVRPAADLPADTRPSVTTTPPSLPETSGDTDDASPKAGRVRSEAAPTGVTPTPVAPLV